MVAFNAAWENLEPKLTVGQSYDVSMLKVVQKQPGNENRELHLSVSTVITHRPAASVSLPTLRYESLVDAVGRLPDQILNVVGILGNLREPQVVVSKSNGKSYRKCDVILVDDSTTSLTLTLWNDDIARITEGEGSVVYLSRVPTKIYAGQMTLAFSDSSNLRFDLNLPRTSELPRWWHTSGKAEPEPTAAVVIKQLTFAEANLQLDLPIQALDSAPLRFANRAIIREFNMNRSMKPVSMTIAPRK